MIFGTHNIHRLPELLSEAYLSKEMVVEVWSKEGDVIENLPKVRNGKIKGWVNIMYGCDKFCTYCIVPYTRGKERSRRPEDIIQEVRRLASEGYKEITLLGQNVNAYGKDFEDMTYGLGDLMDELRKSISRESVLQRVIRATLTTASLKCWQKAEICLITFIFRFNQEAQKFSS